MSLQYAVELMLKRRNQDPLWLYKKIKSLQNVPGVYKRYIRLIRLLQEKGIPVKPVSYEQFRKAAKKKRKFCV